jgi:hypothetical protein
MRFSHLFLTTTLLIAGAPTETLANGGPVEIEVTPATPHNQAIIAVAVAQFDAAGLALPFVRVVFSDDDRACNGHQGLFEPSSDPWRLTICSDLAFVPAHELAHAWIEANIDGPTQQAYTELRGKASWNSPHHNWNERGVEDAAFVIQQNVTSNVTGELGDEWQRRATAYEFLTNQTSPLRTTPTEPG